MKKLNRIAIAIALLSATIVIGWASPSSAEGTTQISGLGLPAVIR